MYFLCSTILRALNRHPRRIQTQDAATIELFDSAGHRVLILIPPGQTSHRERELMDQSRDCPVFPENVTQSLHV